MYWSIALVFRNVWIVTCSSTWYILFPLSRAGWVCPSLEIYAIMNYVRNGNWKAGRTLPAKLFLWLWAWSMVGRWLVDDEGSFSHAHINTKLFCQYLGKYSYFDYLYYYTRDKQGFQKSRGMVNQYSECLIKCDALISVK